MFVVFFFKQKTAYELRISDWSSDVCSSDLLGLAVVAVALLMAFGMIDIDQTKSAQLPKVTIEGGQAPRFQADVGRVDVGTENRTVAVPTIDVRKADNTVAPAPAP